jgi:hypothetical protein
MFQFSTRGTRWYAGGSQGDIEGGNGKIKVKLGSNMALPVT